jgi:magnesium chelatase subunit I
MGADTAPAGNGAGDSRRPSVLPYSYIVGQEDLRLALEIAYVAPQVGGVLAMGERGTAKSTTVRAFAQMARGELPVTLPIGATDDRVLGGWRIESLMDSKTEWQKGLIEEAGGGKEPGILYIDEVNLLDDHLVNVILDVASTGVLTVQRDGAQREPRHVQFSLIGTMNPQEGSLRPQLLDRFGLVVTVESVRPPAQRQQILETVLRFESEIHDPSSSYLAEGRQADQQRRSGLTAARERLTRVRVPDAMVVLAAAIAARFEVEGHRGELVMVRAARALAAINDAGEVTPRDLATVVPLALTHRRSLSESGTIRRWDDKTDGDLLARCVAEVGDATGTTGDA